MTRLDTPKETKTYLPNHMCGSSGADCVIRRGFINPSFQEIHWWPGFASYPLFFDKGTSIVAGEHEQREGLKNLSHVYITEQLAARGIVSKFSLPSAPHFEGVWERLLFVHTKQL